MQQSNEFQNPEVVLSRVKQVIEKNKASDLFHKAFLRPQEIALKTWRTQNDQTKPHDALPYGLKQAIKKDISLNKYVLKDFESFESLQNDKRNITYITENNFDNLISLIKPSGDEKKIQLCICICMYSQDKSMLRKTLAGVSNNIATFVRNGIPSDQIIVAVVMDGIQKVDSTVVQFFNEMEKQSNIYLDDEVEPMQARQMIRENLNQYDEEEIININNFIFDEIEFEDRKKRRFAQRKKQYDEVKKMRAKIEKLQIDKTITFDDLDSMLRPFFFAKAREHIRKENAEQDFALQKQRYTDDYILKEYAENVRISRPIIYEALSEAKSYCQKYIQTRDNLALLNSFRFQVDFGSFDSIKKNKKEYNQLNQEHKEASSVVRMNLMLITKYKNSGKLSSHNWFFNGLCREIKTQFAVLLDVGLCPQKDALFKMYIHMKKDAKCGGVCGYMNLRIERLEDDDLKYHDNIDCLSRFFLHFADIQRAQQVEYHFAHLIDKPFEALFKFIHVLPGAFSAYRMKALQPEDKEDSKLMREYFKSLDQSASRQLKKVEYSTGKAILKVILPDFIFYRCYPLPKQLTDEQLLYDSNVFLAEDRTLCMGIHQNGYELEYLPDSHAWVDPIKHVHGLLGQRKRWINGSFFAFESVKRGLAEDSRGDCCLKLQIFYLNVMNMLAFVSPALFLFTIHIAMFAFRDWFFGYVLNNLTSTQFRTTQFYNSFVFVMDFIYIMLMFGFILKSMHFTHITPRFVPYIYRMSTIMGMFSIAVFIVLIVDMITGIVDSIKCLTAVNGVCQITFLAENKVLRSLFFKALPGNVYTFLIYKWIVVGVVSLYVIPIVVYAMFYCRCEFIADVLFGTFAYIFYTPTYLNILNTFALCRIDDISWGTKGLDAEQTNTTRKELKQSWKSIKILHVAKFIFWNVVVGAIMLIISSPINLYGLITTEEYNDLLIQSYVRKFFMTFFLMVIIGFALFLKIILGAAYSIGYRCSHSNKSQKQDNLGRIKPVSKVDKYFTEVKGSMVKDMENYVTGMVNNVKQKKLTRGITINNLASLIVANKKFTDGASRKKAQEKWKATVESRSKIVQKKEVRKQKKVKKTNDNEPISLELSSQNPQQILKPRQPDSRYGSDEPFSSESDLKKQNQGLTKTPPMTQKRVFGIL